MHCHSLLSMFAFPSLRFYSALLAGIFPYINQLFHQMHFVTLLHIFIVPLLQGHQLSKLVAVLRDDADKLSQITSEENLATSLHFFVCCDEIQYKPHINFNIYIQKSLILIYSILISYLLSVVSLKLWCIILVTTNT